jgi:hypothetical protein
MQPFASASAISRSRERIYDKSFEVTIAGRTMTFDSFECAIQALAPTCPHCGNRIIGHGVEQNGTIFCCVYCARTKALNPPPDQPRLRAKEKRHAQNIAVSCLHNRSSPYSCLCRCE